MSSCGSEASDGTLLCDARSSLCWVYVGGGAVVSDMASGDGERLCYRVRPHRVAPLAMHPLGVVNVAGTIHVEVRASVTNSSNSPDQSKKKYRNAI